jgi:hypothetical protein
MMSVTALGSVAAPAADKLEYNRDIRPLLSDNCFACHGPDPRARKADLRLDVREVAVQVGAIVPGDPGKSELVKRIFSTDRKVQMPPPKAHKKLTQEQKETLRRWIAAGAEYQVHWAYIVPKRACVPQVKDTSLVRNPVDAFVQHILEAQDIRSAPEADRRTLLRRLSLDLIGLPPTPTEVQAFLADRSSDAYEKQVCRLLQSPHFGERMAQHWLDLARYADTVGYHGDQNQNAWVYRDYVIAAFNNNKPFDQFTREQLAGDLLPHPTVEQRVATCFNRLNMMTREGGAQPKEYLARYTADRIRTVGMAWLGSTLNCCECHDHKFDPFTTKDFYSLGAFFADIKQWGVYQDYDYTPNPDLRRWSNDHPWPPEIVVDSPALHRRLCKLRSQAAQASAVVLPARDGLAAWKRDMLAFAGKHPAGWETPTPVWAAGNAKAPEQQTTVKPDGRVVFAAGSSAASVIDLRPTPGWLAAVKIELLPDAGHSDRIIRRGDTTTIRPSLAIVRKGGTMQPLTVRHAQADHYAPQYANGFEVIGVQAGWHTDPKAANRPHTAVYFLETPVRLEVGDLVRVRLPNHALSCIRLSTSPLAPPDVQQPNFPSDLAGALADETAACTYYLRSTGWNPVALSRIRELEAAILACRDGKTPVMVTEPTEKPLTIRVLRRGNWMDEGGALCQPETPHFLPKLPTSDGHKLTRLDLARWLCAPENPLTSRAVVNRLWRQFFGAGLSAQVDDLGVQGEPPTHPELLDWLAVDFRESGWDVKHVVRLIVMSHTYRQASGPRPDLQARDPNNRLLACQNPRRLEAEFVRDNALAIAGLLNPEIGGPPCKPWQPAHYYDGLQFPDREYVSDRGDQRYRRGVYMHWQRTFLHPMLANFDAPSREDCIAIRTSANSPQQALTLLNDPAFVEAASVWAARLLAEPARDDGERIARAFEEALARPPKPQERVSLTALVARIRTEYRARPADAARLTDVGLSSLNAVSEPGFGSKDPVELAAWANVCRVILNLHETLTRF